MNDRGLKVLEQYDLEIVSARRGRGSYICETDRGLKLLCDFRGSEKKMAFQNRILHGLREAGCQAVDVAMENKEGKLVSADRDGSQYVVKDWFAGRECSSFSHREILEAVENLARLHCCLKFPQEEREYCGRPLDEDLRAKNRELKKIRSFVRGREPKHPFEQMFLESFARFYSQADEAAALAEALYGQRELEDQIQAGYICHGDYTYHHVLFLDQGIATTNFGRCRFDFQVNDLYQFMRKILEKQDWDLRLGDQMLRVYQRIRPLPRLEQKILRVRMAYPEKFWKLANHYYGSRKAWIPGRYQEKLELLNRQQEQRNLFLKLLE